MDASTIRRLFFEFFEGQGHAQRPSDSLVPPADDKSLLFTGAGMNQFKDQFLGRVPLTFTRAVTSQKCLRTGDIPNVGVTSFHQTFFEMLGNFSFGDYFKRDAIRWAWELSVDVFKMAPERIHVSVHNDDTESEDIWRQDVGIAEERLWKFGDKDNFWPANAPTDGPNGPCGPCSEMFYDWGDDPCGPDCNPSCDCGRFTEFWNLVFTQFERTDGGVLKPLPQKNIDTGAGLERITAILQNVRTSYDTDLFAPIIEAVCTATGVSYDPKSEQARNIRRLADHARAAVFCVGDGVLPSNQGRGYVLRKLIRQAVRDAMQLGHEDIIVAELVGVIGEVMGDQYPDIVERSENIARIIRGEEEDFRYCINLSMPMLRETLAAMEESGAKVLSGEIAFMLHDTHGVPVELTESVLLEAGLDYDRDGFRNAMEEQRQRSRGATRINDNIFGSGPLVELKTLGVTTEFVGFDDLATEATVLGIIDSYDWSGNILVDSADEDEEVTVVLDHTNFYGESGGQVGDLGTLDNDTASLTVEDTQHGEGMILHLVKVASGRISKGDRLTCRPDVERRRAIERNHTATHLLHHALRQVLGDHAEQSGSLVASDRLRFDFIHDKAVRSEELVKVEDLVNAAVLANDPVSKAVMPISEAREQGATALFGEKYGDEVRMVSIGPGEGVFSRELCGGCHVRHTGEIGSFRIVAEQSVAAGIRRIEAVTGLEALRCARESEGILGKLCATLKAQEPQLVERVCALQDQIRELRAEAKKARQSGAGASAGDLLAQAKDIGGVKIVAAEIADADRDSLRSTADQLRQMGDVVAILIGKGDRGVTIIVGLSKELTKRGLDAVKIARAASAPCGGGGGGRPDMAQAGGQDVSKIAEALEAAVAEAAKTLS